MKKRNISRLTSVFLALMISLALCIQLVQNNRAAATAQEGSIGIFRLRLDNKSEYYYCTAFLLYDEVTGHQYILADPNVAKYTREGFSVTLLAKDYSFEAKCLGEDGYFAYLNAEGIQNYKPFQMGANHSNQIYVFVQMLDEKGQAAIGEKFTYFDLEKWTEEDGVYIANENLSDFMIGAPAVTDMSTLEVIGTIGTHNGKGAYYPAVGYSFHSSFAVSTQTQDTHTAPDGGTDVEAEEKSVSPALIVGVVVIFGMFVLTNSKKKSKKEVAEQRNETVALDPEPAIMPMVQTSPAPQWQIRGMDGPLAGQIFLLNSTLRFGRNPQNAVVFSSNTPGISGNHCQVSIEHSQVVLRDLQSSYGTYLNHMKLEPQISYNLQNGDTFTLAENGQTFRLERCGNMVQDMTPAVRSSSDGRTYRADMNGRISFGRDSRNQVSFAQGSSSVSTNHCILYRENGLLYLKDLNSTNGTFFDAENRLQPNKAYQVAKGTVFFLVSPQNTFVITEE